MSSVIAKKYVRALTSSLDDSGLENVFASLSTLLPAFSDKKFQAILGSSDVNASQKESFILSMFENADQKLTNFIKILGENGRLGDIPAIVKEIANQIALKNNTYEGVLISNFEVSDESLADIEANISKKLDANIKLQNKVTDYPGIKVEVESLGIEVSFSSDRLKSQMTEQILKAL